MTEEFEVILKEGSEELAARSSARPVAAVRARGDKLRRRHRMATAALAVALVAAVGGGALAITGPSRQGSPPEGAVNPATPASSTAPPTVTQRAPSPAPDPATTPPSRSSTPSQACRSLVVPQEVKDAVTRAYRRSQPTLVHITAVEGTFYYGQCDGVLYAGASFTATAGATENELVQLQDEGGTEKYFTKTRDSAWTYVAGDGFPRDTRGCAAIPEIPAGLAALWGDCLARP